MLGHSGDFHGARAERGGGCHRAQTSTSAADKTLHTKGKSEVRGGRRKNLGVFLTTGLTCATLDEAWYTA